MKKILCLLLCIVLLVALAAYDGLNFGPSANDGGNDLFAEASPETSAMGLYRFESIKGEHGWIYDLEREKEILAELSSVSAAPAKNWSTADISYPIYIFEIGSAEGFGVHAAWSNGYLILRDGSAWRFDYDFAALWEADYVGGDMYSVTLGNAPCGRLLLEGENGWDASLMESAGVLQPPKGISMELLDWAADAVTVRLSNDSGADWIYGEAFALHVNLDGRWYVVPTTADVNWAFNSVACILAAGQTLEQSYSLMMFGDLPEGEYRLVLEGLNVKATIG